MNCALYLAGAARGALIADGKRGNTPALFDMADVFLYVLGAAAVAIAIVAGALLKRSAAASALLLTTFKGRKSGRRLEVVEQTSIDGRRRLVLIRRDDVEHLVMTGGPVDVVIETGIGERRASEPKEPPAVLTRRPLGQVIADR